MTPGLEHHGLEVQREAVERLLEVGPGDVDPAPALTFAKNVFVPLTTACRYTCTYCTYFDPPGSASILSLEEVRHICARGADAGCTEALFTFGDDPDDRYEAIHDQLDAWGYNSIHDYLRAACEVALEAGLLPHANPGDQTRTQMAMVAPVNASMGVMLETTADVAAHSGPRQKDPAQRLRTIETAGELNVPFTTGILVGIGETWRDRAESILAVARLHEQYGHIQEFLVQPVVQNERWTDESPSTETMRRVTAMARWALPESISIQVPPNLAPVADLIDCGVDDLGGVSPITTDEINPDYAWPAIEELESIASEAGVPLQERLPVYGHYLPDHLRPDGLSGVSGEWIDDEVLAALNGETPLGRRCREILAAQSPDP